MPSYVTPKKNAEYVCFISLRDQANEKVFKASPTLAAGDVKVSTGGGTEANITTLPAVTPAGSKRVKVTLSAAEMNGDNVQVTFSDAAGSEWCDLTINIQTSTNQIDDLALASVCTEARLAELDAANLAADIDVLLTRLTAARAGYLDNLNVGGNVASQSDVQGITVASRVRAVVPPVIERPDASSLDYRIWIYSYGDTGTAEDLDSNPTVTAENNLGTDRSANLGAVVKDAGTGIYYVDYNLDSTDAVEGLVFKVTATEGGVATVHPTSTMVVDTTAVDFTAADRTKLDAVKAVTDVIPDAGALTTIGTDAARLTAARAQVLTDLVDGGRLDLLIDLIKAVTDQFVFTVANQVDANSKSISDSASPADMLKETMKGVVNSTAKAGTLSATQMSTNLAELTDDHFKGRIITWTSGVLTDQSTDVTAYVGVNGVLTYTAVTDAPSAGDAFVIT